MRDRKGSFKGIAQIFINVPIKSEISLRINKLIELCELNS